MKTILVPIDFSKNAHNALNYAIGMANERSAKLLLLHVYQQKGENISRSTKQKNDKLHILCTQIDTAQQVQCSSQITEGIVTDCIEKMTAIEKIDWLVMGTKGAKGIKEIYFGSNAKRTSQKAHCPVIIVPKNAQYRGIHNIAFYCSYYDTEASLSILLQIIEFAKFYNSHIYVFQINDEECIMEEEKVFFEKFKKSVQRATKFKNIEFHLLSGNDDEARLESILHHTNSDLLAISANNRLMMEKIFGEKTKNKSINRRHIPLAVYNSIH
jgi:nucleotide-binding universal stress UspA family protein